jgi:uncharacterized caspase-like protein
MLRTAMRMVSAVLVLAFAGGAALAAKRVALVIGNAAYTNAPMLVTPKNDTQDMAAALKTLGFTVILGSDLDKSGMDRKILEFEKALSGAEAGVFHYSGHGLQVAGVNYLVPVDANLESAAALRIEAVRLDFIQETMEREAKTNILFLDACRNNPLSRNLARALGTRSAEIGRGLASMESGAGTLISFSTQPGNVALDGSGRNSPYSGPLVKAIGTPGEDVLSMLTGVRNAVMAATSEKQVPWDNNALRAKFYFNPAPAPASPQAPLSADAQAWSLVQSSASEAVLEEFARRFPDSVYAGFAKARLDELKQDKSASWWPWSSGKPAEAEKPQDAQMAATQTKPALAPKDTLVAVVAPPAPALGPLPELAPRIEAPNEPLPAETPVNREVLRIIQTHPFFADAPPVRVRTYIRSAAMNWTTSSRSGALQNVGASVSESETNVRWLRQGLIGSRTSDDTTVNNGGLSMRSTVHSDSLSVGNGLIDLASKAVTRNKLTTTTTLLTLQRIENMSGSIFPVEVGRRFSYNTTEQLVTISPNYQEELSKRYYCEITRKYDAKIFHASLSGSAYLLSCDERTTSKHNNTGNSENVSRNVFFDKLGTWIHADPVSPREQIVLIGQATTTGDYSTSTTGTYTVKSFDLAR